jgi:peptidoglycan/xylan/chitin deacetylase (PgdA/CDA1 family)
MLNARRAVKAIAANVLHYSGLRRALAAYQRSQSGGRRILILSYHRVVADYTGELQRSIPGTLISIETFRRHLREALAAGYAPGSLSDALDVMAGKRTTKKDLCVVTFDDGYRDVYRYAMPVLQAMGFPAMMYLAAGYVGTDRRFNHDRLFHLASLLAKTGQRPLYEALPASAAELLEPVLARTQTLPAALDDFIGARSPAELTALADALEKHLGGGPELKPECGEVMSWDETRDWARRGFELGAHTVNHTVLPLADPAEAEQEIVESKRILERELGTPIRDFAYPNGWYNRAIINLLVKAGFRSAVTTEDLPNKIGGDPFALKRKVLGENFSVGLNAEYSAPLTACHLDGVFDTLGVRRPVPGNLEPAFSVMAPSPL